MPTKLKIAVQKSGRLQEDSLEMLRECGVRTDNGRDQLRVSASGFPLELFFLRNSDIPQYVYDGVADVAILGQNTVFEKEKDLEEVLPLGFARCRLSIAVPKGTVYPGVSWLEGKRIATSYPNTLLRFLQKHHINAEIHEIAGSVEIAPNIGLADAICDLVSSGNTLFMNGLEEKEVILQSEAAVFASRKISTEARQLLDQLIFRIKSVLAAKNNKYLLMNAPNEMLEEIISILPGMKSPTVVPLATSGWSSVHTVISEDRFWEIIDRLKAAGAQGILIIPIQKMIL